VFIVQSVPPSAADLRQANRSRIYRFLYDAQAPVTRQELSDALSISLPTLGQHLEELVGEGLVDSSQRFESTGGRRAQVLRIVPDARFALGVEVGAGHPRLVAVDLRGQELAAVSPEQLPPDRLGPTLKEAVQALLDREGLDHRRLLGIGVASPHPLPGPEELEKALECPVLPMNSAVAGGLAEEGGEMVYLSLGAEVSAAVLDAGGNGSPLAAGHLCIHPGGVTCSCGRRGCLQVYCAAGRLVQRTRAGLEDFFRRVERREGDCVRLWERFQEDLAIAVISLHAMFERPVVLGGRLSQFLPGRLGRLEECLREQDPDVQAGSYLSVCRRHSWGAAVGAALPLVRDFLRRP